LYTTYNMCMCVCACVWCV